MCMRERARKGERARARERDAKEDKGVGNGSSAVMSVAFRPNGEVENTYLTAVYASTL